MWPLPLTFTRITSRFGGRTITLPSGEVHKQEQHGAIDIAVPVGTPVFSIDSGIVHKTILDHPAAGHYVEVRHPNGHYSRYLHLSDIQVKVGDQLRTGSKIGLSGGGVGIRGAGRTTGPHLHLEVWEGGAPFAGGRKIDPEPYLAALLAKKVSGRIQENLPLIVAGGGAVILLASLFKSRKSRGNPRGPSNRLLLATVAS